MSKIKLLHIMMFIAIASITGKQSVAAEENINRLIMSEIYLDEDEPSKNWIEVYNPTDEPLTLIRLRLSTLLTPNILPNTLKDGIEIMPEQCLVICADENRVEPTSKKVKIKSLRYYSVQ